MNPPPDADSEPTPPRATKLFLQGVVKRFAASGPPVLDGIDLEVRDGEFLALLGPSGCGKSTLLNIVAGLTAGTSGQVTMDGTLITGPAPERGVLFQDYALFPWKSVKGNVEFGLKHGARSKRPRDAERRDQIVRHFIDLVGLSGSEHKYPHQLSGGMRQRTALARLWAPDPAVLLMDEPLAALDAQTRLVMQNELLRIWGQSDTARKTVVYVTHAIDEAVFLADRVAVMGTRPGRIKQVLDVDIPRPRTDAARQDPRFDALHNAIWELIREEAYEATVTAG